MLAQTIVDEQLASWGKRELYLVTEEEFMVLLSNGGSRKEIDTSNGDGTFFNSLVFQGRVFCTSTSNIGGVL
jgi:hypothetical protein